MDGLLAIVILFLGAALLAAALVAWRRARDRAVRAEAEAARARAAEREEHDRMAKSTKRLEAGLRQERDLAQRLHGSLRAEREWNRELREQIHRLHEARGAMAAGGNVNALVLEAAIQLVEADKGLLLSREDEDRDGHLDLLVARGFEHDPEHSAVAQRFARQVLDHDQIVRDDTPARAGDARTPADDEIDALVAIPLYLRGTFRGVIVCANRAGGFEDVGDEMLLALGDHAGTALQQDKLRHELGDAHRSVVRVLAEAMAAREPVAQRETAALVSLADEFARAIGLEDHERRVLLYATLLRGVGLLALPEHLPVKPGPLSAEERSLVELHPRLGFNLLGQAPALREVAVAVLYHHERQDGRGYPAGLTGQDIPLAARALAILEAYGAMVNPRPYRPTSTPEEALQELVACAGSQFDEELTALFAEHVRLTPVPEERAEALVETLLLEGVRPGEEILRELTASVVDGLTLLGDHRALHRDAAEAMRGSTPYNPFAVAFLELRDLPAVNEAAGYAAGDRLIQIASRSAQRAAARVGGTAYRAGGRRLAILAPVRDHRDGDAILREIRTEFVAGPALEVALAVWERGERAEDLLERAREALRGARPRG